MDLGEERGVNGGLGLKKGAHGGWEGGGKKVYTPVGNSYLPILFFSN